MKKYFAGMLSLWVVGLAIIALGQGPTTPIIGLVALTPTKDATVTSRPVSVVIGSAPAVTLDLLNGPAAFPCQVGQVVVVTPLGDVNPNGKGPPGVAVTVTAKVPVGPVPPVSTVASVTFSTGPNPPPPDAPCAVAPPATQPPGPTAVPESVDPAATFQINTADPLIQFKAYKNAQGWYEGPSPALNRVLQAGRAAGAKYDMNAPDDVKREVLIKAGTKAITGFKKPANLKELMKSHPPKEEHKLKARGLRLNFVAPDPTAASFSWVTKGVVSAAHDQGQCGSCFIFSSCKVYACAFALAHSSIGICEPSEQALLLCDRLGGNDGCQGGNQCFDYMTNPGVPCLASLPYTADDSGSCPNLPGVLKAASWGYIPGADQDSTIPTVAQTKAALCQYGPLWVTMDASSNSFASYSGGVYIGSPNPTSGAPNTDHAITLVGWDDSAQAWLLENSWNTSWGLNGFWWNKYDTAGIPFMASYVVAQ